MNRRINGQFDDHDQSYRVEKLVTRSGYIQTWERCASNVTLRNAELIRRNVESIGGKARVRHESDY